MTGEEQCKPLGLDDRFWDRLDTCATLGPTSNVVTPAGLRRRFFTIFREPGNPALLPTQLLQTPNALRKFCASSRQKRRSGKSWKGVRLISSGSCRSTRVTFVPQSRRYGAPSRVASGHPGSKHRTSSAEKSNSEPASSFGVARWASPLGRLLAVRLRASRGILLVLVIDLLHFCVGSEDSLGQN